MRTGADSACGRENVRNKTETWFRLRNAPKLSVRTLSRSSLTAVQVRHDAEGFGLSETASPEDAFLVSLTLRPCPRREVCVNGRVYPAGMLAGQFMILDLKTVNRGRFVDPINILHFHLSRSFLTELCESVEAPPIDGLDAFPGRIYDDPVVVVLARSVLSAVAAPHEANDLFASAVMLALGSHVCATNGGLKAPRPAPGGLTRLQEKTAKAMIDAHIDGSISLRSLASACGVSPMHMAHAFKTSVGVPPHQWLLRRRVDRAKEEISRGDSSLAEIALTCGFADQSHLTRVFRRLTGQTPGSWRGQSDKIGVSRMEAAGPA